jgi:acyl-[acyl-carrier-protein]-phospholipid O-acyltransferase / long-chain-fatty-acid--[acyl-carrier-protein] ligase
MTSRRFAPLFWCQFFSAFNDNFVRNMLVMLIPFRFGGENASLEILLATVVFILPSIPLSAHGRIELAPAPFMLLVIAALAIDMGLSTGAMPTASREVPLAEFFMSGAGLRIALEIFVYSAAAGLFVVPIFAPIQAWAGEDRRARVVAAVNALSYIWMVGGSLATMVLLQVFRLSEPMALVVLGVANFAAAIYFFRRLPANILAFSLRALCRSLFRLEVVGQENLEPTGQPNVIAINHVSSLDAPIVFSLIDAPLLFAVDPACVKGLRARLFLKFAETRLLDPARPLSVRALAREVRGGRCYSTARPRSPATR